MPRPVVPTLRVAQSRLVGDVEGHVVRHDHVRAAADPDAGDVDPARAQHVELVDEGHGVDHHAVADDRGDVRIQDARWRQPQLEDLVAVDDRVAGVVAALVAHHHRDLLGQEIGRLALALVAPLQPDDHRSRHQRAPEPRIGAVGGRGEGGRRAKERAHLRCVSEGGADNARIGLPRRRRMKRPLGLGPDRHLPFGAADVSADRCRLVARSPHGTADARRKRDR